MNCLPKREKLDPEHSSEYSPAVRPLAKQVARVVLTLPWRREFLRAGEADSYDSQTCTDLERLAVLHLADDQGALVGKSLSRKEAKA